MHHLFGPDGLEIPVPDKDNRPERQDCTAAARQAAAACLGEIDLPGLCRRLNETPARIRELKSAAVRARMQREEAEQTLALAEAELAAVVAAETGPNGKPRYPNQDARAAELVARRARHPEYRRAYEAAHRARERSEAAAFELEMEQDRFRALRAAAELAAAALRALAPS